MKVRKNKERSKEKDRTKASKKKRERIRESQREGEKRKRKRNINERQKERDLHMTEIKEINSPACQRQRLTLKVTLISFATFRFVFSFSPNLPQTAPPPHPTLFPVTLMNSEWRIRSSSYIIIARLQRDYDEIWHEIWISTVRRLSNDWTSWTRYIAHWICTNYIDSRMV